MIPPFNESGYLPPGIHPATLDEIESRFGRLSEVRQAQMESIRWLVEIARPAGISRILLNGSFATDRIEPQDVDCVALIRGNEILDHEAIHSLRTGLPFVDLAVVGQRNFDRMIAVYSLARDGQSKGIIEVVGWN